MDDLREALGADALLADVLEQLEQAKIIYRSETDKMLLAHAAKQITLQNVIIAMGGALPKSKINSKKEQSSQKLITELYKPYAKKSLLDL